MRSTTDAQPAGADPGRLETTAQAIEQAAGAVMRPLWPPLCGFIAGLCVALLVVTIKVVDQSADTELRVPPPAGALYCGNLPGAGQAVPHLGGAGATRWPEATRAPEPAPGVGP